MSKIQILNQFKSKIEFALELASRDAIQYGYGFVAVDNEGNVMFIDYEEAQSLLDQVKDAANSNR